jgi:hypothetical protein
MSEPFSKLNIHSMWHWWKLDWWEMPSRHKCVCTISHVIVADVTSVKQAEREGGGHWGAKEGDTTHLPQSKPKQPSIRRRCESGHKTDKKCINYMNARTAFINESNDRVEIFHIYCRKSQVWTPTKTKTQEWRFKTQWQFSLCQRTFYVAVVIKLDLWLQKFSITIQQHLSTERFREWPIMHNILWSPSNQYRE